MFESRLLGTFIGYLAIILMVTSTSLASVQGTVLFRADFENDKGEITRWLSGNQTAMGKFGKLLIFLVVVKDYLIRKKVVVFQVIHHYPVPKILATVLSS